MIDDEMLKQMYAKYLVDVPEATETFEEFKEQTTVIFNMLDSHKEEIMEAIGNVLRKPSIDLSKWSN